MTAGRAVAFVIAGMCLGMCVAFEVLESMHASDHQLALVFFLTMVVGSHLAARVGLHYYEKSPPGERKH